MSQVALQNSARTAATEKTLAAALSVTAAGIMAVLKLIVGLLTGSLGMLSDAAHSGIDLAGAVLTLLSVRVSDKPADEDHPYGHAKVENLSAFIETFLMLASSVWITAEALIRIFIKPVALRYSVWPLLVLALSMSVDFWRSRQLRVVATRHQSEALAADALHFASDIWSSAAVFIGLCAAWTGSIFNIHWLRFADPIAAIVVSILILHFAWRLAWRTVGALTDSVAPETRRRVLAELQQIEGVLSIDQARMSGRERGKSILLISHFRSRASLPFSEPKIWCAKPPTPCSARCPAPMSLSTPFPAPRLRRACSTRFAR